MAGTAAGQGRCDVLVDNSGGGDASTVQGGVDAAAPGETVCIADGTYTEHVHVDKDLTLTSARGASPTIAMPPDPPDYDVPESGGDWEVVVFVGPETGSGTVDVDVSGLTLDGADRQPAARTAAGILCRNTSGSVESVTVENLAIGGKQTGGVAVYGDSRVDVRGNTVDGYERFGIVANGDGGAHPSPTVDVAGNDVTGSGDGSGTAWGPNGIQIGYGAAGTVRHNSVDQNRYSDTSSVASGIIVFESDDVTVTANTVTDCDAALTCGTWGWFRQTASGNRFVRNDVDGAVVGVHLECVAFPGFTVVDPTLENTKIVNNDLTQGGTGDQSDSTGVEILTVDASSSYDPTVRNTKVIRNRIDGFATDTDLSGGSDTTARANVVEP